MDSDDNKKEPKIIKFPDGTYENLEHSESLDNVDFSMYLEDEQGSINPKQIIPQFGLDNSKFEIEDKSLSEVVGELVDSEVKRMYGNLSFLNQIESALKLEIQSRVDSGTIDLDTLFDAMDAFGKSVDRSDKIIKQKNSPLVNILIDNRKQIQGNEVNIDTTEGSDEVNRGTLDSRSRKRLTSLLSALLSSTERENEIIVNDYTEVSNEDTE